MSRPGINASRRADERRPEIVDQAAALARPQVVAHPDRRFLEIPVVGALTRATLRSAIRGWEATFTAYRGGELLERWAGYTSGP